MRRSLSCICLAASWLLLATLASCVSTPTVLTPSAVIELPRIAVDARPNGIAIRPADGAVFIADDASNTVLSSSDGKRFVRYAAVPVVAGQPNSLSQLTFANSGALWVARFGFGTTGTVFAIPTLDTARAITGLDPTRRRLGLVCRRAGAVPVDLVRQERQSSGAGRSEPDHLRCGGGECSG